jgi:hypothetical protein
VLSLLTTLKIPKVEKSIFRKFIFSRVILVFLAVSAFSFMPVQNNESYEALDDYKNIVFTLSLHKDNTYIYLEKFMDGSVWLDKGEWNKTGNKIKLQSLRKTERNHNYLKFDRVYKFKGDEFFVQGDTLIYAGKGNQKSNAYLKQLLITKANISHGLSSTVKE